ncbi:Uncharacterized protein HZ326_26095 [Fusarium oxysporum f. sp. albedinis]|nr:Uncharacterized protein HZ326_26095 [Fusarium oxysporum f. sp. albedinis]
MREQLRSQENTLERDKSIANTLGNPISHQIKDRFLTKTFSHHCSLPSLNYHIHRELKCQDCVGNNAAGAQSRTQPGRNHMSHSALISELARLVSLIPRKCLKVLSYTCS